MDEKNPSEAPAAPAKARRWIPVAAMAAVIIALVAIFPPFRIVSTQTKRETAARVAGAAFNPREFTETFWSTQLIPSVDKALNAVVLNTALDTSPVDAAKRYARNVGIGGTAYYYIVGEGRVTAVENDGVHLTLRDETKASIILDTGLVFGNAVRDGTGLLDVNTFPGSEEFNALAAELNRIVETMVLPALREKATVGTTLRFAGVAGITGVEGDPRPLHLIPIQVEAKP